MNHPEGQEEQKPQADAPSEFDTAFAEFSSAPATPPADAGDEAASDQDKQPEPDPQPAPPGGDGAGTEIAADDAPPAPSAEQAPTDIWADAPEALKAAFEAEAARAKAAEHRLASDNGRVAALTRQLDELRRQPAAGGQQQTETPPGLEDLLASDEVKAFETEYPDVAKPILNLLKAQQTQLDQLQGTAATVEQDRQKVFLNEQLGLYEQDHPDWRQYSSDERWSAWLPTQPRHIREAFNRNVQHIVDAAEASDVLTRFKQHIGAATPAPTSPPPPPATPTPTDAKRQKQLDASADVRTRQPSTASGPPDEFGAAFAHFARKANAR